MKVVLWTVTSPVVSAAGRVSVNGRSVGRQEVFAEDELVDAGVAKALQAPRVERRVRDPGAAVGSRRRKRGRERVAASSQLGGELVVQPVADHRRRIDRDVRAGDDLTRPDRGAHRVEHLAVLCRGARLERAHRLGRRDDGEWDRGTARDRRDQRCERRAIVVEHLARAVGSEGWRRSQREDHRHRQRLGAGQGCGADEVRREAIDRVAVLVAQLDANGVHAVGAQSRASRLVRGAERDGDDDVATLVSREVADGMRDRRERRAELAVERCLEERARAQPLVHDHRDLAAGRRLLAEVDRRFEASVGREPQVLLDEGEAGMCGSVGLPRRLRSCRRRERDDDGCAQRCDQRASAAHSGTPAVRGSLSTASPRGSGTNPTLE